MFGKSVRLVIAFCVTIELCHCMVSRLSPPRRSRLPDGVPFAASQNRIPHFEPQAELRAKPQAELRAKPQAELRAKPQTELQAEHQAEPQSIIPFASQISSDESTVRGIDEKYAEFGDFSHQVLLLDLYSTYLCAGALISDRWTLSAAGCSNQSPAKIVVGAFTFREGDIYLCDKIMTHEQFNPSTHENDIALFRSDREIQLNQFVQPIPFLRSSNVNACAENLVAVGWSQNSAYVSQERYLAYVNMSAIESDICQTLMEYSGSGLQIFPTSVCAVGNVKEMGLLCSTNFGVPLSFSGSRVLLGIYSYGDCYANQFLFTGVSNYANWIAQNANVIGIDSM